MIRKIIVIDEEIKWMVNMMLFLLFSKDFCEFVINRGVLFLLID